ncbi:MAG: hypothetical protein OEV94_02915 [Deltaproteobacteria bacterium]|nr:hypothetical protein [Deltaproteobacteria bacterium]
MHTTWSIPPLESYAHQVPGKTYNLWRRYWRKHHQSLMFELAHIAPMALEMEERQWVCYDVSLNYTPVIVWSQFQTDSRPLHLPVPCVVTHYHMGASAIRNRVLEAIETEMENRLAGV